MSTKSEQSNDMRLKRSGERNLFSAKLTIEILVEIVSQYLFQESIFFSVANVKVRLMLDMKAMVK